jgi:hypothetical protein
MKDMFKSICHFTVLMLFVVVSSVFIGGCGTTKNFAIQSSPEGALIIKHDAKEVDESSKWSIAYCGETPGEKKVTFIGDDEYYFTAEKRGYKASTQPVTKESDTAISFNLEKIDGVPEKTFEKDNLQYGSFIILPPDLEVIIHSGIGRMDKMEKSSEKSKVVSEQFYSEFIKAIGQNNNKQIRHLAIFEESIKNDWGKNSSDLNDYILKLSIERLNYYSLPPFITAKVEGFETLIDRIKEEVESDNTYLLYIWGKCISETKGRKAGNIIFSILGPTVAAANPSAIYDPTAFGSSTGTTMVLFVIDAKTSEVLFIEPRYLNYDITDFDNLVKAASIISRFPIIDNKER